MFMKRKEIKTNKNYFSKLAFITQRDEKEQVDVWEARNYFFWCFLKMGNLYSTRLERYKKDYETFSLLEIK